MARVLLAVPPSLRWALQTTLGELRQQVEAVDDLMKGLRATASVFDLAVLDGTTKSLTLNWAIGELKKRNAAVRVFTSGGAARPDAQPLDPATPPDVLARQLIGASEPKRDFVDAAPRTRIEPCFTVDARHHERALFVVGTEQPELFERFHALAVGLTAVAPCPALPALVQLGRDDTCVWAGFAPRTPGCPLSELGRVLRHERSRLSLPTVAYVGLQLCDALEALHDAGLRHGLVRPQAVWLDDEGGVLLALPSLGELIEGDRLVSRRSQFGAARRMDDLPPELVARGTWSWRTDLYQLGHLLYEELTARSPFRELPHDRALTPPSGHDPALPQQLSVVITGLLSGEATSRPPLTAVKAALAPHAGTKAMVRAEVRDTRQRLRALLE